VVVWPVAVPSPKSTEPAPLVAAALAFSETLERFDALAQAVGRAGLESAEGLARAAQALQKVAACEEDLQRHAQALGAALTAAREAQQARDEEVRARALEVQRRGEIYAALAKRFEAVGRDAGELNATAQTLAAEHKIERGMNQEDLSSVLSRIDELEVQMTAVVRAAETLAADARAADFGDLSGKTDALRQQLLAVRNRVGLLKEALTRAVPRTLSS
jgi:hypothetical protein